MKAQIVSFHCVLKDKLGRTLGTSFNQDVINQLEVGGATETDPRLRGLVSRLQDVTLGERRNFTVLAEDAYGAYDPELVCKVPRKELSRGKELQVGDEVMGRSSAEGRRRVYRVTKAAEDSVVLDANHPLAGQDLVFEIEIVAARDARREDFEESAMAFEGGRSLH
jgi:FKBP-type peptidyl-prolyl cis-trans isomerase SlyD